ncbi:MAG: hypothetical protein ACRDZP_02525 [Acidimicrobiales bacterium]
MPPVNRMRHLMTVRGSFHGRVLAARLGAEGVLVELRGVFDGPYPLPSDVEILVPVDQLDLAREILLADSVDAAVDDDRILAEYEDSRVEPPDSPTPAAGSPPLAALPPPAARVHDLFAWLVVALVVALVAAGIVAGIH